MKSEKSGLIADPTVFWKSGGFIFLNYCMHVG